MKVCRPHEHLWKPPLRQAAVSLCVSVESVVEKELRPEREYSEFFLENVVKLKPFIYFCAVERAVKFWG
jgi:hypothetical protein